VTFEVPRFPANKLAEKTGSGRILIGISAGLVVALAAIPTVVSSAALIFSGALAGHLSSGIGLALFGAMVIGLVVAVTSSYPASVAIPQSGPAAILALVAAGIASSLPGGAAPEDAFVTVVMAIALTSALAGLLFLVLGAAKLGTLVKYLPYPVVGGFLAGMGWLLVCGAFGILTDISPGLSQLPVLFGPELLVRWLPSLGFAVALLVLLSRASHPVILPTMIVAAIGAFYLALWLTDTPVSTAAAQGWLLGPFPESALWPPLTFSDLAQVHWPLILGQAGNVATVLIMSLVALLLNTSALELTVRQEIELNRELKSAGLANLVAGLGGGMPGYQALILSVLGHWMNTRSRLVGLIPAVLCGGMLFFGASFLSYFPKPVLGGLLLLSGLALLAEWTIAAWFKLSRAEYGIVLLILVVIASAGVPAGVGVGILLAVVHFVLSYSRVEVVRQALSGHDIASNVDRSRAERQILRRKGDWLLVLELQGFLFFGTANRLLDKVRLRIQDPALMPPRFLLLHFRQVSGLDASAVLSFARIKQIAEAQGISLVLTQLSPPTCRRLAAEGLSGEGPGACPVFEDMDHGVEWCEDQILLTSASEAWQPGVGADWGQYEAGPPADSFTELLESLGAMDGANSGAVTLRSVADTGLGPYLERVDVPTDHCLIRQGESSQGLYLVERGLVTALLECPDGRRFRLRKMGPGSIVGEMGYYLDQPARATVVTRQPSTLYFLPAETLRRMESQAPEVAGALHRYVAQLLGERLSRANDTIQAVFGEAVSRPAGGPAASDELSQDTAP
jgi:SulP family sulfate permease